MGSSSGIDAQSAIPKQGGAVPGIETAAARYPLVQFSPDPFPKHRGHMDYSQVRGVELWRGDKAVSLIGPEWRIVPQVSRIPRADMPHTAKTPEKMAMTALAKEVGVPLRSLYRLKERRPELWKLLEDGIRYRRLKESMQ